MFCVVALAQRHKAVHDDDLPAQGALRSRHRSVALLAQPVRLRLRARPFQPLRYQRRKSDPTAIVSQHRWESLHERLLDLCGGGGDVRPTVGTGGTST